MISKKFKDDIKLSVEIVRIIFSVFILGIIVMVIFFPETFLSISPVCVSKSKFGTDCFMCGMTRAFVEISKGNFYNANVLNNVSIYLFTFFVLNSLIFIYYMINKVLLLYNQKKSVSYF